MIPAAFDYEVAESVEHALDLLGRDPDAKVLAGGHSLVPALKLRIARPSRLVDIGRLPDLAYVRDGGTHLAVGALTRHTAVHRDPLLQEHCPIVSTTAGMIGDPQVRHRGTIGGSLVHGDPASDMPAVMLALGAQLVVVGQRAASGSCRRPSSSTGVFETAVGAGELLTEVRVPKLGESTGWAYLKYHRRAQDWATVGVAALVHRDNGSPVGASIVLAGMGGTPLRARAAEEAIAAGASPARNAAEHAAEGTEPSSDTAASAEFRMHLARVLTRRALPRGDVVAGWVSGPAGHPLPDFPTAERVPQSVVGGGLPCGRSGGAEARTERRCARPRAPRGPRPSQARPSPSKALSRWIAARELAPSSRPVVRSRVRRTAATRYWGDVPRVPSVLSMVLAGAIEADDAEERLDVLEHVRRHPRWGIASISSSSASVG